MMRPAPERRLEGSMKSTLSVCLASLIAVAGCKKGSDADKAPAPTAAKTADPAAAPAAPSTAFPAVTTSDVAECTSLADTAKKVSACAKISDADRAVDGVNIGQLNGVISGYQNEKDKDNKGIMHDAAAANCKDEDAKQKKQLAAAGC
jgi:hypothetical protein